MIHRRRRRSLRRRLPPPPSPPPAISSSIAWSMSSPKSSPISWPIFFMNRATLFGSFSSMSPMADGSAIDSRRASSDFGDANRE